jgi:hypothetical protein
MSDFRRKTKAGRHGTDPVYLAGGTDTLTANTTTVQVLGAAPTRAVITKVSASQHVLVADSDGTVLATLKKWDASASADVTLSAALDLEAMTAKVASPFALIATLTDDQRILDTGDTLRVDIVNNSAAINTQPTGLRFVAELLVLE